MSYGHRLRGSLAALDLDLAQQHRRRGPQPLPGCSDCGGADARHSVITNAGVPAVYCDTDWDWRKALGLEFDARTRADIERDHPDFDNYHAEQNGRL